MRRIDLADTAGRKSRDKAYSQICPPLYLEIEQELTALVLLLLYMKGCYHEYFVGGEILLENLDLVSSFKIKWKNILISSQSLRLNEQ